MLEPPAAFDLSELSVVDDHVHPWRAHTSRITTDELAGCVAFSDTVVTSVRREFLPPEQLAPSLKLFRDTNLGARYLRAELARFLDVEDDWESVAAARNAAAGADYRAWTGKLFADAGISTLLVDEGGSQPRITLQELGSIAPVQLRRVARSDNFIRDLLPEEDSWQGFFQRYQQALDDAIADGAIAFKSVIAYRTGLDVQPVSEAEARQNFEGAHDAPVSAQKPFRDFLLCHTMDVARDRGVWTHIHAAVGDPDIVYQRANPALLYPLLHSERFRTNKVVLIHGGWPWVGEAAAMVAILPNVYMDLSEGAIFGMPNTRQRIMEALEACPYTKILYGADGSVPEALWIVARRFKAVLGRVLEDLVAEGFGARLLLYTNWLHSRRSRRAAFRVLLGNRKFVIGASVFIVLLVISIVGARLVGPAALRSGAFRPNLGIGGAGLAIFGTTSLGQSVLVQLFQAIPNSMLVGLVAATIGTSLGALIGLLSGYFGGKVDAVLRMLIDVFLSVPSLLFAVLIASLLRGVTVPALALIIGLFAWAWSSRAVRAQVLSLKEGRLSRLPCCLDCRA